MQDIDIFYFRKELDYLYKSRELLLKRYPKLAPFLAHNSNDPDVERIIESLAILSAKIHKELDANIPFIAESLINILMPNYTNAIPSLCMQEFILKNDCKDNKIIIPKNTSIKSILIDNIACEFKTIYDVYLYPLTITNAFVNTHGKYSAFTIDIDICKDNICFSDIALDCLTLYLGNDAYTSNTLLLWLLQYLKDIILIAYDSNEQFKLAPQTLQPMGLQSDESLINNDDIGFSSFALLQELFLMPEKFNFVKLNGLTITQQLKTKKIGIKFIFNEELPKDCMPKTRNFSLAASPIINLFMSQAEPILLDHSRNSYRIFVDRANIKNYSVIQVLKVKAHNTNTGRRVLKNYNSFERFTFLENNGDFYSLANKIDSKGEHYKEISFYAKQHNKETISIDLLCSNNNLATMLKLGDINEIPNHKDIETYNLSIPTSIKHVTITNDISWNLVSTLCFSYQTILSKESFLSILRTYTAMISKDMSFFTILCEALIDIQSQTTYRVNGFITQRGTLATMYIDDSKFYCIGEVYKIGLVFSYFFASFAPINSFCELCIVCIKKDIKFNYPAMQGNKALL